MIARFARPVPQPSIMSNETIHWLDSKGEFKLTDSNQQWLTPQNLTSFAYSIYQTGAALENVWGFVNGTLRCRARSVQN